MEGRWARLAVRAQREGVLDYREYTPGDDQWLMREHLLLSDLETSLVAQHQSLLLTTCEPEYRTEVYDRLIQLNTPWLRPEQAPDPPAASGAPSTVDDLIGMYREVIGPEGEGS